jgi:hypothetical protein
MADTVNVFAPELRKKIRKEVDFIPGAWVEFWDDITLDQARKAQDVLNSKSITTNLDIMVNQIVDWNFADAENKKLEVTIDNLAKLSIKLITWISTQERDILIPSIEEETKKKDLPTTS